MTVRKLTAAALALPIALCACAGSGQLRNDGAAVADVTPAPSDRPQHATHDPRLHSGPTAAPALPSPIIVSLDPAVLSQLPREPVTATAHGTTLQCEGIALATLLRTADAMPDEPLKGAQLTRYVQVDARDGYRAVFALAELDPTLGNRRVFLTDRCDGKPLPAEDGPLRLIAPDEARPARWVRQVKSIVVIVAP